MTMTSRVLKPRELDPIQIDEMFHLMNTYYDGMSREVFLMDLFDKDYVILLEDLQVVGFSTQKLLEVGGYKGVFSGDTIIHRDHWGSPLLSQTFARFFFPFGEKEDFYWFLISKGYKTYKFLPTFFLHYYPSPGEETPADMQGLMHAYAFRLYPDEYNPQSGVIEYSHDKDKLKAEIQELSEKKNDRYYQFFLEKNPGYLVGNDLVCLVKLHRDNLRPRTERLLFGSEQ